MKTTNKLLRTAVFSAMAVASSAAISAADAATIKITQYPDHATYLQGDASYDPITIACEAREEVTTVVTDYDLDPGVNSPLGNPTGAKIMYFTGTGISANLSGVRFILSNADFQAGTSYCYLVASEAEHSQDINDDGDTNDIVIVASTPSSIGSPTNNIFLRFNDNGGNVAQDQPLYLVCQYYGDPTLVGVDNDPSDPPADVDAYAKEYAPVLQVLSPDCNSDVTIEAIGEDVFGNPLGGLDASYNTIIDWEDQFALSIHPTLQLIDEYYPSNGRHFVDNRPFDDIITSDDEVELDAADGNINIENDPDETVEDYIHLSDGYADISGTAIFDVALYTDDGYACNDMGTAAYTALDFDNDRMYLDGNGDPTSDGPNFLFTAGDGDTPGSACTLTLTVGETLSDGDIAVPHGTVWQDDVYMGVDGVNRMRFVRWDLDESLTVIGNTHSLSSNDLPEGFFKKWESNGTTLWAPVLNKYNVVVKISHNNPNKITQVPASEIPTTHDIIEVRAKVWDKDEEWCDNILVGTFTDQGVLTMTGKQIWIKAKAQCPSVDLDGQFSAIFTVGAPERDIEAAVIQDSSKGSRSLPIYQSSWRTDDLRNAPDFMDAHTQ